MIQLGDIPVDPVGGSAAAGVGNANTAGDAAMQLSGPTLGSSLSLGQGPRLENSRADASAVMTVRHAGSTVGGARLEAPPAARIPTIRSAAERPAETPAAGSKEFQRGLAETAESHREAARAVQEGGAAESAVGPAAGTFENPAPVEKSAPSVCTGGACRSPLAANLLGKRLDRESAETGTSLPRGEPPQPPAEPERKWVKRFALSGILAALTVLPQLVAAQVHSPLLAHLSTQTPFLSGLGHQFFASFAWNIPLWALLPLGALLGALDHGLGIFVLRLSSWTRNPKVGAAEPWPEEIQDLVRRPALSLATIGEFGLYAFIEEFLFRLLAFGLALAVISYLLPPFLIYPATALLVGLVFSAAHDYGAFWSRVSASLIYSGLFYATGSIWLPVAAHAFSNYWWLLDQKGIIRWDPAIRRSPRVQAL